MSNIHFSLVAAPSPNPDGISELEMAVGGALLTRLIRTEAQGTVTSVRVPAAALGFWIADHWWRLRWEPRSGCPSESWRMAHEMNAIGNGHAWPPVTIWGDRDRVMFMSRADPPGVAGPVRFLTNAVTFVPSSGFEAAMDGLLDDALSAAPATDRVSLVALVNALREERSSPDYSIWRRIEAVSGYDTDEAPEALITRLITLEETYDAADVEEAVVAAQGSDAATTLTAAIEQAARGAEVDFALAVRMAKSSRETEDRMEPWVAAEVAAETLRREIGLPTQPLLNKGLADLGEISAYHLRSHQPAAFPFALRLIHRNLQTVLLSAHWSHDRRFQLARAIGDAIWTGNSSLGAISNVATSRQKFQRAFAAALLCPEEGLLQFFDTADPADSDIAAAARHFHVNEKTVRTVLVNKHLMERRRLGQPLSDPLDASRLEELADAA
ncbi:hypothetical protein LB518_24490 [Mesorhizobium sp. BR1-1-16]|uniref:hypothetical protein n=1 Tax=Mesorhizobium sp. BR1-1-16 TaxID=2876653 RepID=UPI001CCE846E|nr:hypothetical protein [Mesorhizobium sp. BR1-1-16]MBZ9939466.1 hypothetical protein [Mesorhizobium sp. BR1-1-16]